MQRQFIPSQCSTDKLSSHSRSARRLYNRINNNIRVLNKSRISNNSNNSIGSVALRRTELSNDKIYSRQQQFLHLNNSSQFGVDFQSGVDDLNKKKSIPLTPLQSNQNYRQRIRGSRDSRSQRSDSQKSSRYRPNLKKYTKNDIEKLLMMEEGKNIQDRSNGKQQKQRRQVQKERERQKQGSRRAQRQYNRLDKEQMRSSRKKQDKKHSINQDNNNLGSYKSIKSSLKSNIKQSKDIKLNLNSQKDNNRYLQQQGYEIEKLSRKYNNVNEKNINGSKDKQQYQYLRTPQYGDYKKKPQKINQYRDQMSKERERDKERERRRERQNEKQKQRQRQRNLYKYKSQKYLSTNQSDLYTIERRQGKERVIYEEDDRGKQQRKRQNQPYNQRIQFDTRNAKRQKYQQNSLEKYQKDAWMNRKNINSEKYLLMEDPRQRPGKNNNKLDQNDFTKPSRELYQTKKHHIKQHSSILQMRSRYGGNHHLIRIREKQYENLYSSNNNIEESNCSAQYDSSRTNNRSTKRNYKSPQGTRRSDNEYYQHLTPASKQRPNKGKSSQTQISSTFDSLLLSINSHTTSANNAGFDKFSMKSIVDKVDLHLKTLEMIGDYTHEFRKMYEEVEEWEELIFLAYKKFWIERMKVMEYLKKFTKKRRHQSQRIQLKQNNPTDLISHKNISSPLHTGDNPFSNSSLVQNPFIIPFCKVSQEEIKKLIQSEQFPLLMQRLQKQISQIYNSLQQMYNLIIQKSGNHINLLYCDNFSDDIYVQMLAEIEQLIPNLEEFKLFQVTKIRLGKIVKTGILLLHMNGKYVRNISEIIMYDDCEKIGNKKKIKTFTTYDLYYEVFEKNVVE